MGNTGLIVILNFKQMKNNLILWVAALMITATFFTACNKQTTGKWEKSDNGLEYKFYERSDKGKTPAENDWLTVEMIYRTPDSVLYDSKMRHTPMELPQLKSVHQADIYEGLSMMHIGDSATFKCNADSVFQKLFRFKKLPPGLEGTKIIYFDVKMLNIQTPEEKKAADEAAAKAREEKIKKDKEEEYSRINKYLTDNNITVKPTNDSLFVVILSEGNGPKPHPGDTVKVHYTGYLIDGTKFDSSVDHGQPFEFVLGQGRVIKGWDEGIAMLNKGTKAKFVFPSKLGYGSRGAGGLIPPYAPLVFEVELIDFKPGNKK